MTPIMRLLSERDSLILIKHSMVIFLKNPMTLSWPQPTMPVIGLRHENYKDSEILNMDGKRVGKNLRYVDAFTYNNSPR